MQGCDCIYNLYVYVHTAALFELTFYPHKQKYLTDINSSLAAITDNNYLLTVL